MKAVLLQVKTEHMRNTFAEHSTPIVKNQEILLVTGAKGYHKGGGWWLIAGYHYAGKDVETITDMLKEWINGS